MSETKADTTSMGLFFISFLMLVLTLVGFFGFSEADAFFPLYGLSGSVAWILTIGFLFVTFSMWKAGAKFVMIIFGLLTAFMFLYSVNVGDGVAGLNVGAQWLFMVIAIMMIVLALVALLNKVGFMLTLLLLCAGLVFLFYGLVCGADDGKTFLLCIGIFALLSFILSLWLALAMETELGLPVM